MISRILFVLVALIAPSVSAAENYEESTAKAVAVYTVVLMEASEMLTEARRKIAGEKAPLLQALHAAEERIVAAEAEIGRIKTGQEDSQGHRRTLLKERDAVQKNLNYISTLAHDAIGAIRDGLIAGEEQIGGDRLQQIARQFDEKAMHLFLEKIASGNTNRESVRQAARPKKSFGHEGSSANGSVFHERAHLRAVY